MCYAQEHRYAWVLSLDQDSVCSSTLIKTYKKHICNEKIGILTCRIVDRNFNVSFDSEKEIESIPMCITSGSMIRTKAYSSISGYESRMFIDCVDFDICCQIREAGFDIVRCNCDEILHEVGKGRNVRIFGKEFISYNHQPFRHYYIARNHFYLAKKHPTIISMKNEINKEFRTWLIVILYEQDKFKKIKARCKGIFDSIGMNV